MGIDPIENLLNIYRDANGQLLSFEYKGPIFDYVYNQRGDIVAITDELQAVIAKYTYDEWGNLQNIDAPTPLGAEVANANPFRYVGKFGVQYDNDTKIYYMGWRDYDSKIGRFIVADEYESEDNNPISFNRYLYAEADPVNNIDPDGYAPKWLKKVFKGVKKGAKAAYNFAIGDDIRTLTSKKTKWYQKAGAAFMIASNFIPGGGVITKAAKAAIKGTSKAVKAVKASRAVTKAAKVVRSSSKKVVAKVNKKPKTVPAVSFRSSPKVQSKTLARVTVSTPKPKPKATVTPKPSRGKDTRIEKKLIDDSAKATGTAKRPGGYQKEDVDEHGLLSPGANRAPGNKNIASDNRVQSHHPIQNEWAKRWAKEGGFNYNEKKAPAVLLPSSSGQSHAIISSLQRQRRKAEGFNTDIRFEFNVSYREMIEAGVNPKTARKAMKDAYKYFDSLGGFN
ncbi:RHS repeat-associated core domain-containing protein [Bacillus sp. REN3]|uniref:RHS repeat-associated core domain-containing protein n=1 Tax=Bacillus sp. REN3 TaxID=2802440 RepID=UPI001AED8C10